MNAIVYFRPLSISGLTNTESEFIKKKLNLIELPGEGGFYRETYRSNFPTTHTSTQKIYVIDNKGHLTRIRLGNNIEHEENCHVIIRAGLWFGARVDDSSSFALIGCTVTPGFDYKDFELGKRSKLIRMFPKLKATIMSLTNE